MIVDMKKATVICLLSEKEKALERLRELGVLHVDVATTPIPLSEERADLERRLVEAEKAMNLLMSVKLPREKRKDTQAGSGSERLVKETIRLVERKGELAKRLENLHRDREALIPWGEFSPKRLDDLAAAGVKVVPCSIIKERFEAKQQELESAGFEVFLANETKSKVFFVTVALDPNADESLLPSAYLPEVSLSKIDSEIEALTAEIAEINEILEETAVALPVVKQYVEELSAELEFFTNRDAMGESGVVAHISGYIPVTQEGALRTAAGKYGWGLLIKNPGPDDNPPTFIETPKFIEPAKPIFEFIGIVPGYNEWDISGVFLFFFTIFFGMIVGDAGYGFLFLLVALAVKFKFAGNEKLKRPINLFILLSCATIAWGLLGGTVFAIPPERLPRWMRGINWFTDETMKNKHIQYVCFLIAAVHLSLAHIWKAILYFNHKKKALGQIGWALILWGNFFTAVNLIVYPEDSWPVTTLAILYGGGAFLVMACAVDWRDVGDVFNLPFGLIGAFVDLLSYIRLFAVGLSSYYIAASFNNMGLMILGIPTDWLPGPLAAVFYFLLVVFMVLVILSGHVLNVMLAFLGVLVHGIRLNTLEFSNHMELQWLGRVYKPFQKRE